MAHYIWCHGTTNHPTHVIAFSDNADDAEYLAEMVGAYDDTENGWWCAAAHYDHMEQGRREAAIHGRALAVEQAQRDEDDWDS